MCDPGSANTPDDTPGISTRHVDEPFESTDRPGTDLLRLSDFDADRVEHVLGLAAAMKHDPVAGSRRGGADQPVSCSRSRRPESASPPRSPPTGSACFGCARWLSLSGWSDGDESSVPHADRAHERRRVAVAEGRACGDSFLDRGRGVPDVACTCALLFTARPPYGHPPLVEHRYRLATSKNDISVPGWRWHVDRPVVEAFR